MFVDYVVGNNGFGEVGERIAGCHFDPGLLRPYIGRDGKRYVTVNTGELKRDDKTGRLQPVYEARLVTDLINNGVPVPVGNATSLRKDEWIEMDRVVLRAARSRLRAWADLAAAASYSGFNGMAKTTLEYEKMTDPGSAKLDMDGLGEGRGDEPQFTTDSIKLPIAHSDFYLSSRKLAASRNSGTPLDTTLAEAAARRTAELVENLVITGATAYDIYGYTNFPGRITKTDLAVPNGSNATATVDDVLTMRELAYNANHYGPFMLYHSTDWDKYMDDDYVSSGGNNPNQTLRQRLRAIDGITDVRRLDYLTNTYTLILVQLTAEVARAIIGMDFTTVQWESKGGMRVDFKVMGIMVPQLRADSNGNTGIVHGTTA